MKRWGVVLLFSAWIASPAGAAVIVERSLSAAPPAISSEPYLVVVRPLRHVGKIRPEVAAIKLAGEEKNVVFAQALKKMVPPGWKGYIADPRIRAIKGVSWKGENRSWVLVLEEFLMQHGLVATLDWDSREVTVEPGPGVAGR